MSMNASLVTVSPLPIPYVGLQLMGSMQTFNTFQGKTSVRSPTCTGDCATAKICYIRSGSAPIARQNCVIGFGSVQ